MWIRRTVLLILLALGLGLVLAAPAAAQIPDDQRPPLVTDYANYPGTPQAFLTPGCDFSGVLNPTFGARLVATGGAQEFGPVNDLGLLPTLGQGDLVRMAWTDVAPACVGSAVSFVVKVALGPSFDPNVDQLTGPNGGYSVEFLTAGPGEITFPMPDLARFGLGCDYQLDAIVGIPLQDVGPSGSFFSEALRVQQGKQTADNRTTVISAKNGSYANCVVPPTTVPVTTPLLTIPSIPSIPSTTAPITTAPITTVPDRTTLVTRPAETVPATFQQTDTPTTPTTPRVTTTTRPPLAATGSPAWLPMLTLVGIATALSGLILVLRYHSAKPTAT